MPTMTKKGALSVTSDLDRLATLFTNDFATLGVPERVAKDMVGRLDMLADHIERTAGINPQDKATKLALSGQQDHKTDYPFNEGATFDAEEIGEEKPGRSEGDADESYMNGEFTQQENRELRDKQEAGKIPSVDDAPRKPTPGIQANFRSLVDALKTSSLSAQGQAKAAEALMLAAEIVRTADDEEEVEEEEVEVEAGKKKAHGYDLFA